MCDHILGIAMDLNPNEGSAYIRTLQRVSNYQKEPDDWVIYYPHCPLCGTRNIEVHDEIRRIGS